MGPLDLVRLTALMSRSEGRRDVKVALIDGPVALGHPDLNQSRIQELPTKVHGSCSRLDSVACMHGTFVAGMLVAHRGHAAPAICPHCTLLLRPIFPEHPNGSRPMPSATPSELASAIYDSVGAGANVINLSAAIADSSLTGERDLHAALVHAAHRSVLVVAAAGNQGSIGGSVITAHPWVIPVVACDMQGGNDWLCDEITAFSREEIEILVSMLTDEEAEELGLNDESAECAAAEISFVNVAIPDRSVPSDTNAFLCSVEQLVARVREGR